MKKFILVLTLFFFTLPAIGYCVEPTPEGPTPEKKEAIKELLEVTGASKIGTIFGNYFVQQMSLALKKSKPDMDPKIFEILKEESQALLKEELEDKNTLYPLMYPIYDKYLTLQETRDLVSFYKTPLGQKTISVMPKMTQEGMRAGQQWAQVIAPKMQKRMKDRLQKEGITLD